MLSVSRLSKRFGAKTVLSGIDLIVETGTVLGLIGRSGAGKSTLARCLVGLEQPSSGAVQLHGRTITPGRGTARRAIQYLWQDPTQSLSPYLTARKAVLETLNGFGIGPPRARADKATRLLFDLGLEDFVQNRRPHALSGGQCQRVALARALAAEPEVLILDEPLSSLDLTTQVKTLRLLRRLHSETGLTLLIVSHDIAPLRQLSDRIAVLEGGQIVEDLPMKRFAIDAAHPLSRAYADMLQSPETRPLTRKAP